MDDFSDGDMDGWSPLAFGAVGIWEVRNQQLVFKSNVVSDCVILTGESSWKNYIIEVKLMVPEAVGDKSKLAGIIFRMSDTGSYTVGLTDQGMSSYYFSFANGVVNFQAVPFDWELGTWYVLKAVVEEDSFKYYVDGEPIMEYTNALEPKGQVGVQASGAITAYFDDFTITGDDIAGNVSDQAISSRSKIASKWGEIKQANK